MTTKIKTLLLTFLLISNNCLSSDINTKAASNTHYIYIKEKYNKLSTLEKATFFAASSIILCAGGKYLYDNYYIVEEDDTNSETSEDRAAERNRIGLLSESIRANLTLHDLKQQLNAGIRPPKPISVNNDISPNSIRLLLFDMYITSVPHTLEQKREYNQIKNEKVLKLERIISTNEAALISMAGSDNTIHDDIFGDYILTTYFRPNKKHLAFSIYIPTIQELESNEYRLVGDYNTLSKKIVSLHINIKLKNRVVFDSVFKNYNKEEDEAQELEATNTLDNSEHLSSPSFVGQDDDDDDLL